MRAADLQVIVDYNYWADERVLSTAAGLTPAEFTADTRFPHGSLRAALVHVLGEERRYLAGCQGRDFVAPRANDFPDVDSLTEQWRRDEAQMRAYLTSVTEEELDQPVRLTLPEYGVYVVEPRWTLLVHAVDHGTQHRGEAAQILTELGRSPGDLDLLDSHPVHPIEE
jgi:uncharacterized damage-inducible protein DinB